MHIFRLWDTSFAMNNDSTIIKNLTFLLSIGVKIVAKYLKSPLLTAIHVNSDYLITVNLNFDLFEDGLRLVISLVLIVEGGSGRS